MLRNFKARQERLRKGTVDDERPPVSPAPPVEVVSPRRRYDPYQPSCDWELGTGDEAPSQVHLSSLIHLCGLTKRMQERNPHSDEVLKNFKARQEMLRKSTVETLPTKSEKPKTIAVVALSGVAALAPAEVPVTVVSPRRTNLDRYQRSTEWELGDDDTVTKPTEIDPVGILHNLMGGKELMSRY